MVSKILGQSAFWMVNKDLSQKIDIYPALLLSDLIDKQEYFQARGELDEEGYFFNTAEDIKENTTLSYHLQKKCIKKLEDKGLLSTKLKGVPAKTHFKVNEIQILNLLNTSIERNLKLDVNGFEINKNKHNKNKDIYIPAGTVREEYTTNDFLKRWKDARKFYDKQPTNIERLNTIQKNLFSNLVKYYNAKQFDIAIKGLFSQNTYPVTRLNPTHFLENFEQYLTCGQTGEKLYENPKKKKDNTGMI